MTRIKTDGTIVYLKVTKSPAYKARQNTFPKIRTLIDLKKILYTHNKGIRLGN